MPFPQQFWLIGIVVLKALQHCRLLTSYTFSPQHFHGYVGISCSVTLQHTSELVLNTVSPHRSSPKPTTGLRRNVLYWYHSICRNSSLGCFWRLRWMNHCIHNKSGLFYCTSPFHHNNLKSIVFFIIRFDFKIVKKEYELSSKE